MCRGLVDDQSVLPVVSKTGAVSVASHSEGHVSLRHPDNPHRYVMSRSRAPELVEFDEVEHPVYAVASVYGPRHTVNLTMNSSPDIPSYLRQWVSIETNSSTILNPIAPPSETTTSWFDQTPLAVNKRLLPMAAWRGGHRPGASQQQWAMARVNSFVTKSSGTWGKADSDLAAKVRGSK